ncbi:DUF3102 domain-containing protein [Pseudanabaena sp. PCC 6802]|uniref:DUF3102 domain-containing protein n=1 Tax=Pseudanabaena sp. PCC 6802 TaxID=118173 RepID=UPI0003471BF5|nr:DUF3102 domain-containing protein [Pseudanabaena sp. PCC 6802]
MEEILTLEAREVEVVESKVLDDDDFLRDRAQEIRNTVKRIPYAIASVGAMLLEVKERVEHGKFLAWMKRELDWDERMAQRFMQVARRLNPTTLSDLQIQPSALYLLTAPSTPDEVLENAIEVAQDQEVTLKLAKALLKPKKSEQKDDWSPDNWETPDWLAQILANLLEPHEKVLLEPTAGTGQVAKYLPFGTTCYEIDETRYSEGRMLSGRMWAHASILDCELLDTTWKVKQVRSKKGNKRLR